MNELRALIKEQRQIGGEVEGSASSEELLYLQTLIRSHRIATVGEVGFNAGISSYAFLEASPSVEVVSFDIGRYTYVQPAKNIIDRLFPGRHQFIVGDSRSTVPAYIKEYPGTTFDLIFIDGGHDFETAIADLENMKALAHKETIVIMDDITPWLEWGTGPTKAWLKAVNDKLVIQHELVKDGQVVDTIEPPGRRSWAVGQYHHN